MSFLRSNDGAGATAVKDPVDEVRWDLSPLLDGTPGDTPEAAVEILLQKASSRADDFANSYNGKVAQFDGNDLSTAMGEFGELLELMERADSYAQLNFTTDTADPVRGALMQKVAEAGASIRTRVLFFDLEWAALEDARAQELLAHPGLEFCAHHLRRIRRYRPHLLSEPEEKILSEKALSSQGAWVRLFEEEASALRVKLDGEDEVVPMEAAFSHLMSPDREVRSKAADAITTALAPGLRTRAFIYNTLMADKMVEDRLRNFPHWIASRNLANEASDESVTALIEAVRSRFELARRWYRVKAKRLGLERLADYDRNAPVSAAEERFTWEEGREIVLDSFYAFSPVLGDVGKRFFDENWIDAPAVPGKVGGAFCSPTAPSIHPYVLLNYTHRSRDVQTLAHELGHGFHFALAQKQGVFHHTTPLTLAETASVFAELLVFNRLLGEAKTPETRFSLLAESVEGSIGTVFRQVAMNRYEHLAHNERRGKGELSTDRLSEIWTETQSELLGDAVEITEGYRSWWSYIPHFIGVPGYVYAYSYGQLLALSIYARYEQEGEGFIPSFIELLSAGGSLSPEGLTALVGVDIADPAFWDNGLAIVERNLVAAEEAAEELGE